MSKGANESVENKITNKNAFSSIPELNLCCPAAMQGYILKYLQLRWNILVLRELSKTDFDRFFTINCKPEAPCMPSAVWPCDRGVGEILPVFLFVVLPSDTGCGGALTNVNENHV